LHLEWEPDKTRATAQQTLRLAAGHRRTADQRLLWQDVEQTLNGVGNKNKIVEATAGPLTPAIFLGPVFAPISHYRVRTVRRYPRSDGCSVLFMISD
jgi:hypothetical protein